MQIVFLIRGISGIAKIEVKDIAQRMNGEFYRINEKQKGRKFLSPFFYNPKIKT
jgi:hypothetical protein